jgi:membrane-associated phospholipid phosphatase
MILLSCKILLIIILFRIAICSQTTITDLSQSSLRNSLYQMPHSTKDVFLNPITLGTIALAAGVYFTNSDSRITGWALRNHPIYGSVENARTASNALQNSSLIIFGLTSLIKNLYLSSTPTSEHFYELTADVSAIFLTAVSTEIVKKTSNRQRPDNSDLRSFPSGHTSFTSTNITLACDDISEMKLSKGVTALIKSSLVLVVAGTAWGRVEGNKHYTSDVLTGAAVGYVFGQLADNFLNRLELKRNTILLDINPQCYNIQLALDL